MLPPQIMPAEAASLPVSLKSMNSERPDFATSMPLSMA